jgi:hypothetical protein
MVEYIHAEKKTIPEDLAISDLGNITLPRYLIPAETTCFYDGTKLMGRYLISKKAKIVTMSGLIEGK